MSAYDERPATDWQLLARRVVIGAALTCAVIMVLAMAWSFAGLRSFYLSCGLPDWAATVGPLFVDLLALVAYVAWLALGGWYPPLVVASAVLASAAAQGYHTSHGGIAAVIPNWFVLYLAGASAIIFAGMAAHLLVMIIKRALPADFIEALRGAASTLYANPVTAGQERKADPVTVLSSEMPDLSKRAELDDKQVDKLIEQVGELDHFPDMDRLLVDYDNDLAKHNGGRTRPATIHRPRPHQVTQNTSQPSQAVGPCAEGCQHHTGDVSKSARYRCAATLAGRSDVCAPCKTTRERGA